MPEVLGTSARAASSLIAARQPRAAPWRAPLPVASVMRPSKMCSVHTCAQPQVRRINDQTPTSLQDCVNLTASLVVHGNQ